MRPYIMNLENEQRKTTSLNLSKTRLRMAMIKRTLNVLDYLKFLKGMMPLAVMILFSLRGMFIGTLGNPRSPR